MEASGPIYTESSKGIQAFEPRQSSVCSDIDKACLRFVQGQITPLGLMSLYSCLHGFNYKMWE